MPINFLRSPLWVYKWFLKANSSQWNVLGRLQCSLWFSLFIFGNGDDPIIIWKDVCSQQTLEVKNELTISFVNIFLYIVTSFYFDWKLSIFLCTLFLISKCISILHIILKLWTMIELHNFITISWSSLVLNWL